MILNRHYGKQVSISTKIVALFALVFSFFAFSNAATAQDGKALFTTNCASCHHPAKDVTGPALKGTQDRVPSQEWLYSWVKNSASVIASGDKYANELYSKWNKQAMTPFPNLSNEEIDAIFAYVESYQDPVKPGAAETNNAGAKSDNTWLYAIITIVLAVLVVVLWRVNGALERASNEKQGVKSKRPIPIYRHKVFIAASGVVLLALGGYWIANGSIEMHRQQNYMPEQPIFYSHKVHAGINQINCQYCHVGAEDSRQAIIPSANVCMNCHMQISEYTGEDLYTYEGKKVDGTKEIQKLYEYAGWDPVNKKYKLKEDGTIDSKPIEWVKIHNLPDHVYFNHSQHVAVGKVECQSCHGDIQEMDEVKQFAPLSMGWCINCHRQTDVQFENNDYYKIFTKYHQEIKEGKREHVTVEDVGGIDCQKCHY